MLKKQKLQFFFSHNSLLPIPIKYNQFGIYSNSYYNLHAASHDPKILTEKKLLLKMRAMGKGRYYTLYRGKRNLIGAIDT
jgi:hypothetical protein